MKKILVITSLVAFLILAGLLAVPYFIDVDDYKDQVSALIKQKSGRDVQIKGKISLRILPDIALTLNDVSVLSSVKDDGNLLSVSDLVLKMKLIPLLNKRVEIDSLKFIKPVINLHVLADGSNNWSMPEIAPSPVEDGGTPEEITEESLAEEHVDESNFQNAERSIYDIFQFKELKIADGSFTFKDDQSGQNIKASKINLDTALGPNQNPFALSGKLDIFEDEKKGEFAVSGQYSLEGSQINVENVDLTVDEIKGTSNLILDFDSVKPTINISLTFGDMKLNGYDLAKGSQPQSKEKAVPQPKQPEGQEFAWSTEPIDLSFIGKFDGNLSFKTSSISYDDISTGAVIIGSYLRNNKLSVSLKKAEIYGGDITGEFIVNSHSNSYDIYEKINLAKIDLSKLPLKSGFIKSASGILDADIETSSSGKSQKALISTTKGTAKFKTGAGVIGGFDLFSMVQNVTSAFNLGAVSHQTAFSEISGDFVIKEGVMSNDNFILKSNVANFSGAGDINLNDLTINYKLTPQSAGSAADAEKIATKIPVLITGKLAHPVFRLEVKSIVEDLINNPKGPENLMKQLKRDFKDMKKGTDEPNTEVLDELKNIFQ